MSAFHLATILRRLLMFSVPIYMFQVFNFTFITYFTYQDTFRSCCFHVAMVVGAYAVLLGDLYAMYAHAMASVVEIVKRSIPC